MVKRIGSIRSDGEELKSITQSQFVSHYIALDMAGHLPETKNGNKYILVAIDHYSKWCEA
jgi:hypothetical protein